MGKKSKAKDKARKKDRKKATRLAAAEHAGAMPIGEPTEAECVQPQSMR